MLVALAAALPAAAEAPPDPEPEPPEVIEIPGVDEALPSALDTLAGTADDRAADGELDLDALLRHPLRSLLRSRLSLHPVAGWTTLSGPTGGHAVSLGGAVGHQLYTLDVLPLKVGLDSRLEATAPIGGARGYRFDARTALAPWFGPLGVSLGPTLRADRQRWAGGAELVPALLVGAELGLVLDTGLLQPRISVAPAGVVAGDRGGAVDPILPVLLDETTWRAGLRWSGRPVELGVEAALHESAAGSTVEAGVSVHVRAF